MTFWQRQIQRALDSAVNRGLAFYPGQSTPRKAAIRAELATADKQREKRISDSREAAAVVTPIDKMPGYGLENPHALFDQKTLYVVDEMMRDEACGTFVEMKKAAALSVDWHIKPAVSDDPKQVEVADCMQIGFDLIEGSMIEAMYDMFSAIEYGYSASNVVIRLMETGEFKGKIGLKYIKTKPPHNIRFDTDKYLNILDDGVLYVDEQSAEPVERLRKEEFAIYTYRRRFNDPYGYGDCIRAFDRWNSKRWINKFWDIWLERHATGTIVAKYNSEANPTAQEHEVVTKFLSDKQVRSGIKISDLWDIEMHEASAQNSTVFADAVAQRNTAIARALLLPDLLGFSEKPGGAYALGKKHFDVFLWILLRLHRDMSEVMQEQVIRRIVDLNFGPQDKYPEFVFDPLTDEQKVQWLTNVIQALKEGAITHDQDIENAIRAQLELAEKEEDEEERAGGAPPPSTEPKSEPEDDDSGIIDDGTSGGFQQTAPPVRLHRAPNQYEKKVDFEAIASFVTKVESAFTELWSDLMAENQRGIIEWTRRTDIVHSGDYVRANDLRMKKTREQTKALQRYLETGVWYGGLQSQREIKRARSGNFEMSDPAEFAPLDVATIPLTEIEKVFKAKGLVTTQKLTKAAKLARKDGFFITNVENEAVLSRAKNIIMRGIKRGDQQWTEGSLRKMFDRYLATGELTDAKLGQAHRVAQIARENFSRAMNEGRRAYYEDPDVEEFILAYEWSSIMDDVTTDYCAKMDQRVLRKEELNAEGWPPAHYGCRSEVIAVTDGEDFKFSRIPSSIERGSGFCAHEHGNTVLTIAIQ